MVSAQSVGIVAFHLTGHAEHHHRILLQAVQVNVFIALTAMPVHALCNAVLRSKQLTLAHKQTLLPFLCDGLLLHGVQ